MSLSEHLLGWDQFRAMPLYLQFAVGLMILYAAAMTALSALVAPSAADQAAVLFAIGAFVWAFALYVVPSRLASKYTSES